MKVKRKADGLLISDNCTIADTAINRMIGLLNRKSLQDGEGLFIRPCNSIHTFFMRFSIDVLFLSKENKVVAQVKELHPWRITLPRFSAVNVLELSSGAIEKLGINNGDELELCDILSV